jgi:hypothetical protein
MKLKGISVVEQHVDKLVLGLAGAIFLTVVGFQLISRNEVRLDNKAVGLDQVDPAMKEKAESVGLKLRDDAPAPVALPVDTISLVSTEFESGIAKSVSPGRSMPPILPQLFVIDTRFDAGTTGDAWFYVPSLMAPAMVSPVIQTADALAEGVLEAHPELAAKVPSTGDISFATAVARLPIGRYRAELHKADPGASPPKQPIPTPWYEDSLFVPDVVFEREELQADGTWGNLTAVAPLPGNFTLRPQIDGAVNASTKDAMIQTLKDRKQQFAILQPPFFLTKNESFTPPDLNEVVDPNVLVGVNEVDRLKGRIRDLDEDIALEEKRLTELGGPLQASDDKKPGDKGDEGAPPKGGGPAQEEGGGGFGVRGGPDRRGGGGDAKGEEEKKTNEKRRIGLTKKVEKLKEKRQAMLDQLTAKGGSLDPAPDAATEQLADLNKDEELLVWAHDIDVQPGKVYRYRCMVRFYNPFFARTRQLVKEQAGLADSIVMDTAHSEWSAPVEITPPVTFFITRAAAGEGNLHLGQASVEVYRLYDGKRRREEFTVQPGDRIGRVKEPSTRDGSPQATIDFSTDWYVVDIYEDQSTDAEGRPGAERSAVVVLKRIGSDTQMILRDPRVDAVSSERTTLRHASELDEV